MIATLQYHRRHGAGCAGEHPKQTYSDEYQERKKGWKKCQCPITASGSLGRLASRLATKQTDWEKARQAMAPYIAANSWKPDGLNPPSPPDPSPEPRTPARDTTVKTAIQAYMDEHREAKSAFNTLKNYRIQLGKLQRYADQIGLTRITQWDGQKSVVRELRTSWGVSPMTSGKNLGLLKAFFEFCVESEWIKINPARIKRIVNRASKADETEFRQRIPFSDEEIYAMYAACERYGKNIPRKWPKKKSGLVVASSVGYREYARVWTGEDLSDFISVSVYTGLRISDVATFHISSLLPGNQVEVRTKKNGTKVYTVVPAWLTDRIQARAARVGPLIFGAHRTDDINTITNQWRNKLKDLWDLCPPWAIKPEPHRFRHTFARILLQSGTPVSVVAELMGNTEAVVRKHYSAWVPERQEASNNAMRNAFANAPQPGTPHKLNVVPIKSA